MKIVVIGCGPSGIVTAIKSKNDNNEVIVLEKNEKSLKKLLITGNGKCNYFNEEFVLDKYYSKNMDLLKEIINEYNKNKVLNFMNEIGVVPRIKDGYYYPASNQAYSVYNSLIKEAKIRNVKIINNYEVKSIKKENNKFIINNEIICDKLVVSTGSYAYPKTGSTGDGYKFASSFNHKINKVRSALTGINCNDKILKELSGVRSNCKVSLVINNEIIKEEIGEVQFTDYGLSGICIFNLSVFMNEENCKVYVNFLDEFGITKENFKEWLSSRSKEIPNRTISELLESFLNYKIVNSILKKCKINQDYFYNDISEKDKDVLLNLLLSYPFNIDSLREYDVSQVCAGGISLNDVNINNFMSKKIENLFFTGEILDVTGICGGYNLGFAFLSGIIVGDYINDSSK